MKTVISSFRQKAFLQLAMLLFFSLSGTALAQCTPDGDPAAYGQNKWLGYIYADTALLNTPPANPATATYRGYLSQSACFDLDFSTGALSGTNICGSYADNYAIRFKMQRTFTAGYYNITVGADDSYRLSFDGGATFITGASDWTLHTYSTKTVTVLLSGTVNMVFDYFEKDAAARVSFAFSAVSCQSTAPTAITGNTALSCSVPSTALTAAGGSEAPGSTYQWGTGSIEGQNIISGATSSSLTVSPTATTTYWVRRVNAAVCGGYSGAVSTTVTVAAKPGDPSQFGDNAWTAYGYAGGSLSLTGTTYTGYYTQSSLGFDTVTGSGSWDSAGSPSSSATWQGCAMPSDNFTLVYKRRGFPCGKYALTMKRWDEEIIVYINGVQVWYKSAASVGIVNNLIGTFDLDASSTVEVRLREGTGNANAILALAPAATAPTYIGVVYSSGSAALTAGGALGNNLIYQWGTGNVPGENVIAGATTASIVVSPTSTTTYWVRLANFSLCNPFSGAVFVNVAATVTSALGVNDLSLDKTPKLYSTNGELHIVAPGKSLEQIMIFDLSGRLLLTARAATETYSLPVSQFSGQIVIVQAICKGGSNISQKVIL